MYTEASSPRADGDVTYLEATFNFTALSGPELSFYYHMYGAAIGSLHVDIYYGAWNNDVWSISGQQQSAQTDPYLQAVVDLSAWGGMNNIKVRFRGIVGSGASSTYYSDIAIDLVEVYQGTVPEPPLCTTPTSPMSGAVDVSIGATLNWAAASGATGYYIYFGTGRPPTNIENGTDLGNVTSYTPASLIYETAYYWSIVPYNAAGLATGCAHWNFDTENTPPPPVCTTPVSPLDGASGVTIGNTLSWNAVGDADGYVLFFGTDNPPTNLVNGVDLGNVTSYDPGGLNYSTAYLWQVVPYTAFGSASGCAIWDFITEDTQPSPNCSSPVSPLDGATDVAISANLQWNAVGDADGYYLYFGTDNPPTNIENGTDLGNVTSYAPASLDNLTVYYWEVVPYNGSGSASGCATWSFTTEDVATGPVELSFSDFESGFGIWTDGGGDGRLYTSGNYAPQGSNAADIQDNSGVASSFYLTNGVDVQTPGYIQIDVEFEFLAISMDNSNEDFWVQYYDGSTWHTVADFDQGIHFDNNVFYIATVSILEADYNFPTDMKIRFMCDASGNRDDIYVDQIRILASTSLIPTGFTEGLVAIGEVPVSATNGQDEIKVYPNPASDVLNISMLETGNAELVIYNMQGQIVYSETVEEGQHEVDLSEFVNGIYMIYIYNEDDSFVKKIIKN